MPGGGNGDKYYALEKFDQAMRHLATSDGPWRERLRDAYRHISPLGEEDMPPGAETTLRDYRALIARMTWAESKGEGTLPATLALISDQEARAIAALFADVECGLAHAVIDAQRKGERWGAHH
jgi:hypothetical protein